MFALMFSDGGSRELCKDTSKTLMAAASFLLPHATFSVCHDLSFAAFLTSLSYTLETGSREIIRPWYPARLSIAPYSPTLAPTSMTQLILSFSKTAFKCPGRKGPRQLFLFRSSRARLNFPSDALINRFAMPDPISQALVRGIDVHLGTYAVWKLAFRVQPL